MEARPFYPMVASLLPPGVMFRAARFILPPEQLRDTLASNVPTVQAAALLAERGLLRLPAPLVWVERHLGEYDAAMGMLCVETGASGAEIGVVRMARRFGKIEENYPSALQLDLRSPPVVAHEDDDGQWGFISRDSVADGDEDDADADDELGASSQVWFDLVDLLVPLAAEPGFVGRTVEPPARRDGHGRRLLPVVEIGPTVIRAAAERYAAEARKHPPREAGRVVRLHDVRGHIRRLHHLGEGRTTWVRPHPRGDAEKGVRLRSHYEVEKKRPKDEASE